MKLKNLILLIVLVFTLGLSAQQPDYSEPVLKTSDVENFVKNYKKMAIDFKMVEVDFAPKSDIQATINGLGNLEKANKIARKYGFTDMTEFATKVWAVMASYSFLKMETNGSPELKQLMKNIDENPNMTAEQKTVAKEQLKQALQGVQQSFSASANKKDIETVRPYMSKIEKALNAD